MAEHRSVSQLKQYERCPYSYKLARIDRVWQRPAAWTAQGSAVHKAIELTELQGLGLEQAKRHFIDEYCRQISTLTEVTPRFDYWAWSGPYGGEVDIERRYRLGLEQIEKYFAWMDAHPEEVIWLADDGTPGIELEFDIDLDGVRVRGVIDQVVKDGDGLIARDVKTGRLPEDFVQLGVYSVALAKQFGATVSRGDFWMAKSGKATYPYDLSEYTESVVTQMFHELDRNIGAGLFPPRPQASKCRVCDVRSSCEFSVV